MTTQPKTSVVIGTNFGDEGKGLMTDYLSEKSEFGSIVIRFNGGAQAGHTVERDGVRHVFGHFGSNSLQRKSCTFLSRFFLINPMVFRKEHNELVQKRSQFKWLHWFVKPLVFVDPAAKVTTPFDMIINQLVEMKRAGNRHGSCGLGIGETEERSQHKEYLLDDAMIRFCDHDDIKHFLIKIRDEWTVNRAKQLNVVLPDYVFSESLIDKYIEDITFYLSNTQTDFVSHYRFTDLSMYDVIFEGAQGLMLDQNALQFFPHVTRSNTGIKNVLDIINDFNDRHIDVLKGENLNVYYMNRAYMTRHGAGPFTSEMDISKWFKVEDKTNIPNDWQGTLRFGIMNTAESNQEIWKDIEYKNEFMQLKKQKNEFHYEVDYNVVITCIDQSKDEMIPVYTGIPGNVSMNSVEYAASKILRGVDVYGSYGTTAKTIKKLNKL